MDISMLIMFYDNKVVVLIIDSVLNILDRVMYWIIGSRCFIWKWSSTSQRAVSQWASIVLDTAMMASCAMSSRQHCLGALSPGAKKVRPHSGQQSSSLLLRLSSFFSRIITLLGGCICSPVTARLSTTYNGDARNDDDYDSIVLWVGGRSAVRTFRALVSSSRGVVVASSNLSHVEATYTVFWEPNHEYRIDVTRWIPTWSLEIHSSIYL
jgi:hypothetical protein